MFLHVGLEWAGRCNKVARITQVSSGRPVHFRGFTLYVRRPMQTISLFVLVKRKKAAAAVGSSHVMPIFYLHNAFHKMVDHGPNCRFPVNRLFAFA